MLYNEPRSRRSQVLDYKEFINTQVCVSTLEAEALLYLTSIIPNIVGATKLGERDVELTITPLLKGDFGNIFDEDLV